MDDLMLINSIPALIQKRNDILQRGRDIDKLRKEIDDIAGTVLEYSSFAYHFEKSRYEEKEMQREVDSRFWNHIITTTAVTNSMTEKAKSDYLKKIHDEPPEFTAEIILAFAQNANRIYGESIEQTIKEVFRTFTACHYAGGDWRNEKVSNCQRIEPKFRVYSPVTWCQWSGYYWRENTHTSLEDLLTALSLVDDKGRPAYDKTCRALFCEQEKTRKIGIENLVEGTAKQPTLKTDYFTVTFYKNGNAYVVINEDKYTTLEQLNKIGTSGGLPDTMKKKYKPEHFNG
jgi:hypothetical protein